MRREAHAQGAAWHPRELAMFDPVSAAQALAALARSHVLFRTDLLQRQLLVDACVQAWNIGQLPAGPERDAAVAGAAVPGRARVDAEGAPRFPGWAELLHVLVEQRCQLFPHIRAPLQVLRLEPGPHEDELRLRVREREETIRLAWNPHRDQVSVALPALVRLGELFDRLPSDMHGWLQVMAPAPDIWATRAGNRCNLLLLELAAHRSALAGLRVRAQDEAQVQRDIRLLDTVEEKVLIFIRALQPVPQPNHQGA